MNYPEIKVGTTPRYGGVLHYTYKVTERTGDKINLPQGYGSSYYHLSPTFMRLWSIVDHPLSIQDIILNETYTDGQFQYYVVFKNATIVLAYRDNKAYVYTQDDISSWKKYVKPVPVLVADEYELVWSKGSGTSKGRIVAEFTKVGKKVNAFPENILRREKIVYKEEDCI